MLRTSLIILALSCLSGCATNFGMSEVRPADYGARTFEFESGDGYHRPSVYLAPQVTGLTLKRTPKGAQTLSWTALGEESTYKVTLPKLESQQTLILVSEEAGGLELEGSEVLLLTAGGAQVAAGEATALLTVLANPRLYLGAEFVNTVVPESFPIDLKVRVKEVKALEPEGVEGAAASQGFAVGDVILKVACGGPSSRVESRLSLAVWLSGIEAGRTLQFTVEREGRIEVVSVSTRERRLSEFRDRFAVLDDSTYLAEARAISVAKLPAARAAKEAAAKEAAAKEAAAKEAVAKKAAKEVAAQEKAAEEQLAQMRAARDKAEREGLSKAPPRSAEQIAEERKTPAGLSRLVRDAIAFGDPGLLEKCWISREDADALLGKKLGRRWHRRAERERAKSWALLRHAHPGLSQGKILSVNLPVRVVEFGEAKLTRVKAGAIRYQVEGRRFTLSLAALFQLEDGTWKAFALVKARKTRKDKE